MLRLIMAVLVLSSQIGVEATGAVDNGHQLTAQQPVAEVNGCLGALVMSIGMLCGIGGWGAGCRRHKWAWRWIGAVSLVIFGGLPWRQPHVGGAARARMGGASGYGDQRGAGMLDEDIGKGGGGDVTPHAMGGERAGRHVRLINGLGGNNCWRSDAVNVCDCIGGSPCAGSNCGRSDDQLGTRLAGAIGEGGGLLAFLYKRSEVSFLAAGGGVAEQESGEGSRRASIRVRTAADRVDGRRVRRRSTDSRLAACYASWSASLCSDSFVDFYVVLLHGDAGLLRQRQPPRQQCVSRRRRWYPGLCMPVEGGRRCTTTRASP